MFLRNERVFNKIIKQIILNTKITRKLCGVYKFINFF